LIEPASRAVEEKRAMVDRKPGAGTDGRPMIDELRELIQALDRRVPQFERRGETEIVRDAEALKHKALERIANLEGESRSEPSIPAAGAPPRGEDSTR
jgi:hypothetical protein